MEVFHDRRQQSHNRFRITCKRARSCKEKEMRDESLELDRHVHTRTPWGGNQPMLAQTWRNPRIFTRGRPQYDDGPVRLLAAAVAQSRCGFSKTLGRTHDVLPSGEEVRQTELGEGGPFSASSGTNCVPGPCRSLVLRCRRYSQTVAILHAAPSSTDPYFSSR